MFKKRTETIKALLNVLHVHLALHYLFSANCSGFKVVANVFTKTFVLG